MKRRWVVAVIVGMAVATYSSVGRADDGSSSMSMGSTAMMTLSLTKTSTPSAWTSESGYANRAGHKLEFGLRNFLLGWTELFTEPQHAIKDHKNVFVGIGYGLKNTLEDELGGAVHVVTFPITAVDAPLPQGGVNF